jgi:hypothetical protein
MASIVQSQKEIGFDLVETGQIGYLCSTSGVLFFESFLSSCRHFCRGKLNQGRRRFIAAAVRVPHEQDCHGSSAFNELSYKLRNDTLI